jgi:hypothetical protein
MLAPRLLHLKGTEARVGVKDVTQVCYTFTSQMKECKISAVSGVEYWCHRINEYPILCPRCSSIFCLHSLQSIRVPDTGFVRHQQALHCPAGGIGRMLCHRYTIAGSVPPDPADDTENWCVCSMVVVRLSQHAMGLVAWHSGNACQQGATRATHASSSRIEILSRGSKVSHAVPAWFSTNEKEWQLQSQCHGLVLSPARNPSFAECRVCGKGANLWV